MLAGLSADYLRRLEQGRQRTVSDAVLRALGRALRLDEVEQRHLHQLAAPPSRGALAIPVPAQRADPGLLRLMTALDHVPVLLLGMRLEVLARNALLPAVLGAPLAPGSSFLRYLFQDPLARERIVNWADFASASVAGLRSERGRHPEDRLLAQLVEELRRSDRDVARWWEDYAVRDYASVAKHIRHPTAGPLSFGIEIVNALHEPDQHLVVYTTEPHSRTADLLPLLASWEAERVRR